MNNNVSSALIGCFTVRLKVELCSDWLFYWGISVANASGNTGEMYISVLSCAVILLGNYTGYKMRASGLIS